MHFHWLVLQDLVCVVWHVHIYLKYDLKIIRYFPFNSMLCMFDPWTQSLKTFIVLPFDIRSSCIDKLELDRFIDTEEASSASAINFLRSALDDLLLIFWPIASCGKLLLLRTELNFWASRIGVDILSRVSKISLAVELIHAGSAALTFATFAEFDANDDDGRE